MNTDNDEIEFWDRMLSKETMVELITHKAKSFSKIKLIHLLISVYAIDMGKRTK